MKFVTEEEALLAEARGILESSANDKKCHDDELICECLCISVGMIREIIKGKEVELDVLKRKLMLGSGCGSCAKTFESWKLKI